MNELKRALKNELSHVQEVYFDSEGNWYLHKNKNAVTYKSREEILSESGTEGESEKKKKK